MWPINSSDPEGYISGAAYEETLRVTQDTTEQVLAAALRLATPSTIYMVSEPPATVVVAPATTGEEMMALLL